MTRHFLLRYLAILGLGSIFGAGQAMMQINDVTVNWGVLQAIGMAGLITLVFIRQPTWWRLAIGLIILSAYQFLLDRFWLDAVLASPHGGLPGSMSWAGLLILATVLADLYHDRKAGGINRLLIASTVCIIARAGAVGMVSDQQGPGFRDLYTSLFRVNGWFFWVFHLLVNHLKLKMALFTWWGRNPLILYILHLFLQGLFTLPFGPNWNQTAPPWLVSLQVVTLLVILTLIARYLDKKKILFSI